ncbi:MAG: hypothetical protein AABX77_01855 [Nanoarchaeota archaeon]
MAFNFDNSKKLALIKKDKSNKKAIDKKIKSLCEKINSNKNYFTTSSCSGRIVLIIDEEKKKPDLFLFRTHNKINFINLKKEIDKCKNKNLNRIMNKTVYFKQEPCILVVSCRDKENQWKLFSKAKNNGWKKSGILSLDKKLLTELMSTENISFPVINKGKLLVGDDFLKIVVKKANNNLKRGWEKIKRLEILI